MPLLTEHSKTLNAIYLVLVAASHALNYLADSTFFSVRQLAQGRGSEGTHKHNTSEDRAYHDLAPQNGHQAAAALQTKACFGGIH